MASWWSAIHGYNPRTRRGGARADRLSPRHVRRPHPRARRRAGRATDRRSPRGLEHVFLADSGSVSVEVALKLALQYQGGVGPTGAQRFLTMRGGYHGDTFGRMSVCDPVDGMHSAFPEVLAHQVFAERPPAARGRGDGEGLGQTGSAASGRSTWPHDELAGIIVEPLLQGAGGMHVYHPDVPARAPRGRGRARAAPGLRRDRDRLRPHRQALRRRVGRGRARHHVRRQGADRRLPHSRSGAVHRACGRGLSASSRGRCCTGPRSWATRSPAPSRMRRSTCSSRAGRRTCPVIAGLSATSRRLATCRAWSTCAPSALSASCSSTTRST